MVPAEYVHQPRVLILGSAPSVESIAKQQYYAHKMNHFWPIVREVFQLPVPDPESVSFVNMEYTERVRMLWEAGVAVWDVCQLFVRQGSADSALKCTAINPVEGILAEHPSIEVVGLNGQTAYKLFVKNVVKAGKLPREVRYVCLPSSSPLHAMRNAVEEKARQWKALLQVREAKPCDTVPCL
jgi:double-stranded uracil-DNA glycosylase